MESKARFLAQARTELPDEPRDMVISLRSVHGKPATKGRWTGFGWEVL